MMSKMWLIRFSSIFLMTIIFANENNMLWDFGVVINQSNSKTKLLLKPEIDTAPKIKAMISDPFIPPTIASISERKHDISFFSESRGDYSLNNIYEVKLLVGRLTMQNNYQMIIDVMGKIDLHSLNTKEHIDLNYWLANALLQTGEYAKAKDLILENMDLAVDDRFHFLLAMTYESQGYINKALEEYIEFSKQFPKSDYKAAALIKARILGRH